MIEQNTRKINGKALVLPNQFVEEDRGFNRCCFYYEVRASDTSDSWKNDINIVIQELVTGNVTYTLQKCIDGEWVNSGYTLTNFQLVNDTNVKYVVLDWQEIFFVDGVGKFRVIIDLNLSGILFNYVIAYYNLLEYSPANVKNTVRFRGVFNRYFQEKDWNFEGSNLIDDVRVSGYFGDVKPNTQVTNLVYSDRYIRPVTRENVKKYSFESRLIPIEMVEKLTDFTLLGATELYVSDFSPRNLSYNYLDKPIILDDEADGVGLTEEQNRKAILTAQFKDARVNKKVYKL